MITKSGGEIIQPLSEVEVLAIDELGRGRGSAFELETMDELIARRYNAGRVTLFGTKSAAPLLLAPVAAQGTMHAQAERATACAARSAGVPMVLSTMASTPLEEVATILDPVGCWSNIGFHVRP